MKVELSDYISGIKPGDRQQYENMEVFPLFSGASGGPEYLIMKEALAEKTLIVTEVAPEGSVPELKVLNRGGLPVLILDGEELSGAKQNRILNTTVLLKEKSETVIPVSCTEQGRWRYTSPEFSDSGYVVSCSIKASKMGAVSRSLEEERGFQSCQGEVWDQIGETMEAAGVDSPSMAMKDVYEDRRVDLEDYRAAFPVRPRQRGLLVLIGGRVIGLDMISRGEAYAKLHDRLVKSYALDALLRRGRSRRDPGGVTTDRVHDFLKKAALCEGRRYPSVGHGWDYRFRGDRIVGSALVYRKTVIHTAFFRSDDPGRREGERATAAHRRRSYRL